MLIVLLLLLSPGIPPLHPPEASCFIRDDSGPVSVTRYIGDRTCVAFDEAETMSGVWLNVFEGSEFIEGRQGVRNWPAGMAQVWLSTDNQTVWPRDAPAVRRGRAYRIEFIGRRARDKNRRPLEGYGHMAMSRGLVLVDEVLRIEDIGAATEVTINPP